MFVILTIHGLILFYREKPTTVAAPTGFDSAVHRQLRDRERAGCCFTMKYDLSHFKQLKKRENQYVAVSDDIMAGRYV